MTVTITTNETHLNATTFPEAVVEGSGMGMVLVPFGIITVIGLAVAIVSSTLPSPVCVMQLSECLANNPEENEHVLEIFLPTAYVYLLTVVQNECILINDTHHLLIINFLSTPDAVYSEAEAVSWKKKPTLNYRTR